MKMSASRIEFLKDDELEERRRTFETITKLVRPSTDVDFAVRFLEAMFLSFKKPRKTSDLKEILKSKKISSISPKVMQTLRKIAPTFRAEVPIHYSLFVSSGKVMARTSIYFNPVTEKTVYNLIEPKVNYEVFEEVIKKAKFWAKILGRGILDNKSYLLSKIKKACKKVRIGFREEFYDIIKYYLHRDLFDFGKINALLYDHHIYEIICDGLNKPVKIFHGKFRYMDTNIVFRDEKELNDLLFRFAKKAKSEISKKKPFLNVKYKNFRIYAALGFEEISPKFVIKREA